MLWRSLALLITHAITAFYQSGFLGPKDHLNSTLPNTIACLPSLEMSGIALRDENNRSRKPELHPICSSVLPVLQIIIIV